MKKPTVDGLLVRTTLQVHTKEHRCQRIVRTPASPGGSGSTARHNSSMGVLGSAMLRAALLLLGLLALASGYIDVVELTASEIQAAYEQGEYTAEELTMAFLERIEKYEPVYNSFVYINPDAIEIARAMDMEYAESGPRGPLHGVPVVIKDNQNLAGVPTSNGYWGFRRSTGGLDMIPARDASVVARLKEAGAIIMGKTNLPDFARSGTITDSSANNRTYNSYGLDLVPGGSSGGTATAVSGSFAVLGLGTETGGSIQNPSAAQSLVGIKPSLGLVPIDGIAPLVAERDVAGPMTKTVEDAAATLEILAGVTLQDVRTFNGAESIPEEGYVSFLDAEGLQGKRLGVYDGNWGNPLDPEVEAAYEEMLGIVMELGAELVTNVFNETGWSGTWDGIPGNISTLYHGLSLYFQDLGDTSDFNSVEEWEEKTNRTMGEDSAIRSFSVTESGTGGDPLTSPTYWEYVSWRSGVYKKYREIMEEEELDGLIYPFSAIPLPTFESGSGVGAISVSEINHIGVPVLTLPAGYLDGGQPFAINFIGTDLYTEPELITMGYAFEQATMLREAPLGPAEQASLGNCQCTTF